MTSGKVWSALERGDVAAAARALTATTFTTPAHEAVRQAAVGWLEGLTPGTSAWDEAVATLEAADVLPERLAGIEVYLRWRTGLPVDEALARCPEPARAILAKALDVCDQPEPPDPFRLRKQLKQQVDDDLAEWVPDLFKTWALRRDDDKRQFPASFRNALDGLWAARVAAFALGRQPKNLDEVAGLGMPTPRGERLLEVARVEAARSERQRAALRRRLRSQRPYAEDYAAHLQTSQRGGALIKAAQRGDVDLVGTWVSRSTWPRLTAEESAQLTATGAQIFTEALERGDTPTARVYATLLHRVAEEGNLPLPPARAQEWRQRTLHQLVSLEGIAQRPRALISAGALVLQRVERALDADPSAAFPRREGVEAARQVLRLLDPDEDAEGLIAHTRERAQRFVLIEGPQVPLAEALEGLVDLPREVDLEAACARYEPLDALRLRLRWEVVHRGSKSFAQALEEALREPGVGGVALEALTYALESEFDADRWQQRMEALIGRHAAELERLSRGTLRRAVLAIARDGREAPLREWAAFLDAMRNRADAGLLREAQDRLRPALRAAIEATPEGDWEVECARWVVACAADADADAGRALRRLRRAVSRRPEPRARTFGAWELLLSWWRARGQRADGPSVTGVQEPLFSSLERAPREDVWLPLLNWLSGSSVPPPADLAALLRHVEPVFYEEVGWAAAAVWCHTQGAQVSDDPQSLVFHALRCVTRRPLPGANEFLQRLGALARLL